MTALYRNALAVHREIERLMWESHLSLESAVREVYSTASPDVTTALAKLDYAHDSRSLTKARLARKPYRDD
jgi:hypothetical protein